MRRGTMQTRSAEFSVGTWAAHSASAVLNLVPLLSVSLAFFLVATGALRELERVSWRETGALVLVAATVLGATVRRLRRSVLGLPATRRTDAELGGLLIAAAYLIGELFGPAVFPTVYLLMAFLVAFLPRWPGVVLVGVAVAFDMARSMLGGPPDFWAFGSHSAFLVLFAALYHAVLAVQVATAKGREKAAIDRHIKEMEERARAYRLVTSGTGSEEPEDAERWVLASVKEIEGAVGAATGIAELALKTHTCAVFVLSSDDKTLRLHDCRSASDHIRRDAFPAGEGVLGAVLKRRAAVRLCGPLKGINYYEDVPPVRSVLAVPVVEAQGGDAIRGVLVADRLEEAPFTEEDERLLAIVAGETLRAIEVERVLTYVRRARDEKDRLFRAIEELNRASKTSEAVAAALDTAKTMGRLDFAAITLAEEEGGKRRHRIVRACGTPSARSLDSYQFEDNTGLVANVVRYGVLLPGRDVRSMEKPIVFDESLLVKGVSSLKILPLRAGERILGTLVVGSRRKAAFDDELVRNLEVLAIQVAQSMLRAHLFEQMERMATTDGLTGLVNHRTFQTRFDEALQLANRYEKKVAFVLTDIDHFKSVNDTYGHLVGDQVLKGVAAILRRGARDTDVVARYGGEEFCLVVPETDTAGAKVIAERIRKEVQAAVFETELGPLRVTMSLGIASFPDVSRVKAELIEKADQCLYFAKQHGRNQSVTVQQMETGGRMQATRDAEAAPPPCA